MRPFRILVLCVLGMSGVAHANEDLRQASALLQADASEQGTILVANGRQEVQQLQRMVNRPLGQNSKAIVVTGRMAEQVARRLQTSGAIVQVQGFRYEHKRVLVMVGPLAWEFEKVLYHVYGRKIRSRVGLTVIKGQLHEVVGCLDRLVAGSLNLGLRLAGHTAHFIYCSANTVGFIAGVVLNSAGYLVCKTAEGIVVVTRFAVGTLMRVVVFAGEATLHVARGAIVTSYRIVGGVFRALRGLLRDIFGCVIGCDTHFRIKI